MTYKTWGQRARTARRPKVRRLRGAVLAGVLALATLGLTPSAALADNAPAVVFSGPTSPVTTTSVSFSYTINRGGEQVAHLTCSLSGPVTSTSCGTLDTVQHSTSATVTLSGLTDGSYTYTVDLGPHRRGGASASTTFTVDLQPDLTITPPSYDFGSTSSPVVVGHTDQETFTVGNTGGPTSGAPTVGLGGTDPSQWQVVPNGNGCTSTLGTNATCDVTVEFAPTVAGFSSPGIPSYTPVTDSATLGASADGASASASLSGTTNWGCTFDNGNCNLSGANLSSFDLIGFDLSGANLSGANLSYAILENTNLSYANLASADLFDANLAFANLSGANLTGAILTDVLWSETTCPDSTNSGNDGGTCANNL